MKLIYNNNGEHIGTIIEENDYASGAMGLSAIVYICVAFFLLLFSPFILYFKGKKDREDNDGFVVWLMSLVVSFFLGTAGGLKFYEGKIAMGILYMFTCGLFGIGALYDFILLLCRKSVDLYNPYASDYEAERKAKKATIITISIIAAFILLVIVPLISAASR